MFDKTRGTFWAENRQIADMASFFEQDLKNANPTVAQVQKILRGQSTGPVHVRIAP